MFTIHTDLVFLLDMSSSINDAWHGGSPGLFQSSILPFVQNISRYFTIGKNRTQIAVASFAGKVFINFNLSTYDRIEAISNAIANIQYTGGGTQMVSALHTVRTKMFVETAGQRSPDKLISRVLMIVSDGQSSMGSAPEQELQIIKESGIRVYYVGVGYGFNITDLTSMVSEPTNRHLFTLKPFSNTTDVYGRILCNAPYTTSATNKSAIQGGISKCEMNYFQFKCGPSTTAALLYNITISMTAVFGKMELYISKTNFQPGPMNYDFKIVAESEFIVQNYYQPTLSSASFTNVLGGIIYVGVKGIANHSDFTLNLFTDIYALLPVREVMIRITNNVSVQTVIYFAPGIDFLQNMLVYTMSTENVTDTNLFFAINSSTGAVYTNHLLNNVTSVDTTYTYNMYVTHQQWPCLQGRLVLHIIVSVLYPAGTQGSSIYFGYMIGAIIAGLVLVLIALAYYTNKVRRRGQTSLLKNDTTSLDDSKQSNVIGYREFKVCIVFDFLRFHRTSLLELTTIAALNEIYEICFYSLLQVPEKLILLHRQHLRLFLNSDVYTDKIEQHSLDVDADTTTACTDNREDIHESNFIDTNLMNCVIFLELGLSLVILEEMIDQMANEVDEQRARIMPHCSSTWYHMATNRVSQKRRSISCSARYGLAKKQNNDAIYYTTPVPRSPSPNYYMASHMNLQKRRSYSCSYDLANADEHRDVYYTTPVPYLTPGDNYIDDEKGHLITKNADHGADDNFKNSMNMDMVYYSTLDENLRDENVYAYINSPVRLIANDNYVDNCDVLTQVTSNYCSRGRLLLPTATTTLPYGSERDVTSTKTSQSQAPYNSKPITTYAGTYLTPNTTTYDRCKVAGSPVFNSKSSVPVTLSEPNLSMKLGELNHDVTLRESAVNTGISKIVAYLGAPIQQNKQNDVITSAPIQLKKMLVNPKYDNGLCGHSAL